MTKRIEFIFDFGSPNAYLVHKVLPEIVARTGALIDYVPCLLGGIFKSTNNRSPLQAYAQIPAKMAYEQLEMQRFITRHDLSAFRFNPHFPVNTLLLMRGAIVAQNQGALADYCAAAFQSMWEDGQKMDDPQIMAKVLTAAGLNGAALVDGTNDPRVKAQLIRNTESAVERGAFGIPTIFVGNQMFFGKERLGQVEECIGLPS